MSLAWAGNSSIKTLGAIYLTTTPDDASAMISNYTSSTLPVTWSGISSSVAQSTTYLQLVGSPSYDWYVGGQKMTKGSQVGTSGQYKYYIGIDITQNPSANVKAD